MEIIFAAALLIAGALIFATSLIIDSGVGFIGIGLMLWGIAEYIFRVYKKHFSGKDDK